MLAHVIDDALPVIVSAFFVNAFVADDGKFVYARRNENQYGITLSGFVHSKLVKFTLSSDERVDL